MANRLRNIVELFSDLKARTIIIVTLMIIIFGLVIGFLNYKRIAPGPNAASQIEQVPMSLSSIPGQQHQNIEYAKLQEKENVLKVERALKQGTSAIPTIIETSALASDSQSSQAAQMPENVIALALAAVKQSGCSVEALKNAKDAGASATDLRQLGCSLEQLQAAAYSPDDLLKAGFGIEDLRRLGYGLEALRNAGVCSCDLKHAGYTAMQLKQAGFKATDLKCACFSDEELAQAGLTIEPSITQASGGCDPELLAKARIRGATPTELRQLGCNAPQLKQLGLSAVDLKQAYSPEELRTAGYTAGELLAAGHSLPQLKQAGYSAQELRNAGASASELLAGGYSVQQLREAGYTPAELRNAGYTEEQIKQAGYSEQALKAAGIGAKPGEVKLYDCSAASLRQAKQAGVSAAELRNSSGCGPLVMQQAGYEVQQLKEAGFTAGELKKAGFNAMELAKAGFTAVALRNAGFTPEELRRAAYSATALKQAGFGVGALKNVGFNAKELKEAGFNAGELKRAGFSNAELKQAGFSAKALSDAGYSLQDLKNAAYTSSELKQAGFSAKQLKEMGFEPKALLEAGFNEQELKDAGFSANELILAGIQPKPSAVGNRLGETVGLTGVENADGSGNEQIATLAAQQQQQFTEQQLKQSQQEAQANMQGQAQQLFGKWTEISTQVSIEGMVAKESAIQTAAGTAGLSSTGAAKGESTILKAGAIMFAVLDTAVNSDEPGPIMATIVDGQFKGAKLLGTLQVFGQNADRVMLSFSKLSLPHAAQSIAVSAVAIDPDTARTALSSKTDHHYLLRYGSLFASSFLQGYGQAVLQSGTIEIDRDAVKFRQSKDFSTKELVATGLGQVGQTWGTQLGNIFNRPATIHVYAGTSVGILFRDDTQLPN